MSDTTQFFKQKITYWNPVITRALLWVGIAVLTDFRHSICEISKKVAAGGRMTNDEFLDAVVGAALAGFIALRLFLDQTLSRHQEEQKKSGNTQIFVKPP